MLLLLLESILFGPKLLSSRFFMSCSFLPLLYVEKEKVGNMEMPTFFFLTLQSEGIQKSIVWLYFSSSGLWAPLLHSTYVKYVSDYTGLTFTTYFSVSPPPEQTYDVMKVGNKRW
jgi:hypothetical protein